MSGLVYQKVLMPSRFPFPSASGIHPSIRISIQHVSFFVVAYILSTRGFLVGSVSAFLILKQIADLVPFYQRLHVYTIIGGESMIPFLFAFFVLSARRLKKKVQMAPSATKHHALLPSRSFFKCFFFPHYTFTFAQEWNNGTNAGTVALLPRGLFSCPVVYQPRLMQVIGYFWRWIVL